MRAALFMFATLAALWCARGEAADALKFVPPKNQAEWDVRSARLRTALRGLINVEREIPKGELEVRIEATDRRGEFQVERLVIRPGTPQEAKAVFVRAPGSGRRPLVVYCVGTKNAAFGPGLDGREPALELAKRGMSALAVEPIGEAVRDLPLRVGAELDALDYLVHRDDVDASRIAALGVEGGGVLALWLAAIRPDIKATLVIGGATRFDDLPADAKANPADWLRAFWKLGDTELLAALIAPRKLEIYARERDPLAPPKGIDVIASAAGRVSPFVDGRGQFHVTRLGADLDKYGLLQWDASLEILDKQFFPQTTTPLGHAPEPEPTIDDSFVNPAEFGIAGWQAEMSHRPGTWSWKDGVISCLPGPNEYGWLRCPIPVDDFALSVEWKIPPNGNAGVFIRAKRVPWDFPPSVANKQKVSALSLEWPSRTGLELQCSDDKGEANKYTTGSLYRHAAPSENPSKPTGEWNRTTVRCRGTRVELWINGRQVMDTNIDKYPNTLRNPPLKGYFGLQNHGAPAEFRNVRFKAIPMGE